MSLLVQPVITIMMVVLTWQMAKSSFSQIGIWQSLGIAAVAFWAMHIRKIHPALVICAAFLYGGIVLQHIV
ncbi:Chromate transporter [Heyndrickxia coagulans 2-6]|nr:Chromate transporter [Heyndrickxia coagulans 2-6]